MLRICDLDFGLLLLSCAMPIPLVRCRFFVSALCAVATLGCGHALAGIWQPSAGHTEMPIWPGPPPDAKPMPGPETAGQVHKAVAGKPWTYVANVSTPTI